MDNYNGQNDFDTQSATQREEVVDDQANNEFYQQPEDEAYAEECAATSQTYDCGEREKTAKKALKLSIIGACLSCISVLSLIFSVLGLANGIKSLRKGFDARGLAGTIIGGYTVLSMVVGIVVKIVMTIISIASGNGMFSVIGNFAG